MFPLHGSSWLGLRIFGTRICFSPPLQLVRHQCRLADHHSNVRWDCRDHLQCDKSTGTLAFPFKIPSSSTKLRNPHWVGEVLQAAIFFNVWVEWIAVSVCHWCSWVIFFDQSVVCSVFTLLFSIGSGCLEPQPRSYKNEAPGTIHTFSPWKTKTLEMQHM